MTLKGRSFLTLKDYSKDEILYLISLASQLKAKKKGGSSTWPSVPYARTPVRP